MCGISYVCKRECACVFVWGKKCERGMFYLKKGVCLCVCLCIYNSEWACPLTGCVCQGPRPPSDGGLGAAVNLPRARHAMCWWACASCAAWSGSPGTWAAGRGRTGVRVGNRKQLWSALCPHKLMETGGTPPLPTSARGCHHSYHFSQSEYIK